MYQQVPMFPPCCFSIVSVVMSAHVSMQVGFYDTSI